MAASGADAFARALEGFKKTLTQEQRKGFEFNSLQDVEACLRDIRARYGPEKKLRNMQRLSKFLSGMEEVEKLVSIFLNVHEVVAFVWGPVKFALMIAGNRLETLEVLLDTYVEIGEAIPGLRQYEQMFKNYPYLKEILERCFHDILEFHKEALNVFTRTGWKKYFDCAWNTFKARCKPIIESLRRHRALLSDEKLTAAVAEIQEGRREVQGFQDAVEKRFRELSQQLGAEFERTSKKKKEELQESLLQSRRTISSQLSPGSYESDQCSALSRFFRSPRADWVFQDTKFKSWLESCNSRILYLCGMPGAGKTTLTSRIIDYLQSQKNILKGPVLYFYFKSLQEDKRSMGGMLRALVHQLIHQDDIAAGFVRQKWSMLSETEFKSLPVLQELVQDCLATPRGGTIVLDGLDECQDERGTAREPCTIIAWIHQRLIAEAHSQGYPIRILVSSQHVDFLEEELTKHPSIRLDQDAGHLYNIHAYTMSEAVQIQKRFSLTDRKRDDIVNKVSVASNVVLDNLMDQGSQSELDEELATDNFPGDLEAAYERVVIRVFDHGSRSKKAAALQILTWMTSAARPLYWREIQSRFCINPELGKCGFGGRRVDSCKALCSSLVEEETPQQVEGEVQDPIVRLVHNTAGKYLVHTGRINLVEAHVDMSLFCSQYLASEPFQDGPRAETIQEFAMTGYYGFLDYAVANWVHHLSFVSKSSASVQSNVFTKLVSVAARLLQSYEIAKDKSSRSELVHQSLDEVLQEWPGSEKKNPFEGRISVIREAMESICVPDLDDNTKFGFLELNGVPCFKCPKPNCYNFAVGFSNEDNRCSHIMDHERPFKCFVIGCFASATGFRSQPDLQAHAQRYHPPPQTPSLFSKRSARKATDIFEACNKGDLDRVKTLVEQGADVNGTASNSTPLALAAKRGHHLVCQFLIEKGATQVFLRRGKVLSALDHAIKANDHELVSLLIRTASDASKQELVQHVRFIQTIWEAVPQSDQILADLLSMCEANPVDDPPIGRMPGELLHAVISKVDSVSKCQVILNWNSPKRGGKGEAFGSTQSAAKNRYSLLLWPRVKIEESGAVALDRPLNTASKNGRISVVRFLLHQLKQSDTVLDNLLGDTPLHEIARGGEKSGEIAELLVKANPVAANFQNNDDCLPVHLACDGGHDGIVALLAGRTDDLDRANSAGNTPLRCAVLRGYSRTVKALLETQRVDVLRTGADGRTVFDLALHEENVGMLGILHSHGHTASVARRGYRELFQRNPIQHCVENAKWRVREGIEMFLSFDMDRAWYELSLTDRQPATLEQIYHLLSIGNILTAKVCLSNPVAWDHGDDRHDLWVLAKGQEDAEIRALALLRGAVPQSIWAEHLPEIKMVLQDIDSAPALRWLLQTDWSARQVLITQVKQQGDRELMELLTVHGFDRDLHG